MDTDERPAGWNRRDVVVVMLLMLAVTALRFWQVSRTVVPSRDSIAYIHFAWLLEHDSAIDVIRASPRHPGYPLAVWGVSWLARGVWCVPEPVFMQGVAQFTNALASILLVIPVFFLARAWLGRPAAIGAVLFAQLLPPGGSVYGDGLSEGLFLLLAFTALWATHVGLETGSGSALAACGLCSGLAYLVRPEGLFIAGATGLVLLARQCWRAHRIPVERIATLTCCLILGTLATAAPLVEITGKLTPKPTANRLLLGTVKTPLFRESYRMPMRELRVLATAAGSKPASLPRRKPVGASVTRGLLDVGNELLQGLMYYLWAPLLFAAWTLRRSARRASVVVFLICAGTIVALMSAVAVKVGYASDRHMIFALVGGGMWASAGLFELGKLFEQRWRRAGWVLLAVALLPLLIRGLMPLHGDRAGYRQAGLWLARHSRPDDVIVDTHGWAAYYAGRAFIACDGSQLEGANARKLFVVLGRNSNQSRVPSIPFACSLAEHGEVVFETDDPALEEDDQVLVHELPMPSMRQK